MVKADVRKDYYADLGLQPSAEAEDIKKQFRKLALKYHPDRNPGREVEFNAKFQAIQAANEILSDPSQRLKYDTDRLRAGYGKYYGPPKANTQRKTQPPHLPSSPYTNFDVYEFTFKQQDNAQTRADAFHGFNNMRGGQPSGWQGFDPSTGRATGGVPGPGAQRHPFGTSAQSTRPKSAFEAHNSHSNAQSFKKKQGFAPGVAGGDEPMARNTSAYSNNSRTERMSSQYFKPAVPPTAKKPTSPEPSQPNPRHSYTPEFERPSRSYAQAGKGEKTFLSSTGLGRSATMRTPSGSHQNAHTGKSPASGRSGRYRSASPSPRRNANNYDSTSSSEGEEPRPKPKAVPKSRLGQHQKFADFRNPGTASPGNGMDFDSFLLANGFQAVELPDGHTSDSAAFPKSSYRSDHQPNPSGSSSSVKYVRYAYYQAASPYLTETGFSTDPPNNTERPQSAAYERSSTSYLHKKFSADDWRDHLDQFDFIGSASPNKESLPRSPASQNRGRTNFRNGATQASSAGSPIPNPFGPTPLYQTAQQQQQQPPTPFAQAKFSADSWSEQLRNLSWTVPEVDKTKQTASAAPRSPKKQSRAGTKLRSAPQPASVATEADEAKETVNGQTPSEPAWAAAPDVEEMDLDEDLPTPGVPPNVPVGKPSSGSYPDLASQAVPNVPPVKKSRPPSGTDSRTPLFNLDNLRNTVPLTQTTGGGIENLEDFHTTLPFESQAKQQKTTTDDIRPRALELPNPPKRPWAPKPVPLSPTSKQLVLPRDKWNCAVGDSTRLKINGTDDNDDGTTKKDFDDYHIDEFLVPGTSKGGFSAYLRGIEEDTQVRKHWEVACELHRDCILDLGRLREWIRDGGKMV
ncbi:hypothetical protein N7497_005073 [Penicillium chrysogenum]|nr:hypothetical protein N7497_005073 [Penicillium chrysogenum]